MKTFFKILLVFVLLTLAAFIAIPLIFKNEIMQKVKVEINKHVKAKVDWTDFSVSLFRGFPDLKVTLDGLSVVGVDEFQGDTLIAFQRFMVDLDLFSMFSKNIRVKSVILDRPVLRAIVLDDGSVNWDITYPSDTLVEEVATDTAAMELNVSLRKFEVRNGSISYIDRELDMGAWLNDFSFILSGDFTETFSDLVIKSYTREFDFDYEGIRYINKAALHFDAIIAADLEKYEFTFRENNIVLNEMVLGLEGLFGMPNDKDIEFDISFFAKETSFKSVLSMVPAIYMKDFEDLTSSGNINLTGTAKGLYNENEMPKINLELLVNNGYFSYPDLPGAVENVNMDLKLFYDGVYEDNSSIDIHKFYMEIGGNPVDARLRVITLMSDMQMTGAIKGRFDLGTFKDVFPLDDMKMEGRVNLDLEIMGKMSDIENENYEAFMAEGLFEVMEVEVSGGDMAFPVNIEKISLLFSPSYLNLTDFIATIGSSDLKMNGRLENFIPYVFSDQTIKGQLDFKSSFLNLNELMMQSSEETVEDTAYVLSVVEVPGNIDFVFTTGINKVLYDKLEVSDLNGKVIARNGRLIMDKLEMKLLKGSMLMSGEYNTADIKTPMVDFNLNMRNIDITSAFSAFNTVESLAPLAEYCLGNITVNFNFTSFLDSTMYPVLTSIVGNGRLRSDDIEIAENKTFEKMSELLKNNSLKNPRFRDVDLSFEMRNGRVHVQPFDVKLGTIDLNIAGDQGIDQTMNYLMNLSIPRSEFGTAANDVLENLASKASARGFDIRTGEKVNVQLRIAGSFSDPQISMDVRESLQSAKAEVLEAVQERVQEEVERVTKELREGVSEEINRIMQQAEEEAEKIKSAAREAGDRLVGEARLQGNNLVSEAGSNPLRRAVAQRTAEELERNARQQAQRLNDEAEQRANKLLEDARKKAEELQNK